VLLLLFVSCLISLQEWEEEGPVHMSGRDSEQMTDRQRERLLGASAVVVSRCAPQHKAGLVAWLAATRRCVLAVGDGGNDVAMLHAAHVGIGLAGREGSQVACWCVDLFSCLFTFPFHRQRWLETLLWRGLQT
jgi:magnesium-transporting ATPase (P-type)